MITCACGACFEVDEALAGQEVLCPECQRSLKAPALDRPPRVTSGWALASVVLALVGAFTVFGSLLAVLLGVIALASIARNRRQIAGAGFAIFGICLGVAFTGLTLFALNTADVFGLDAWLRERTLTQQVDTSGPLEIVRGAQGFAITRPTEKWGKLAENQSGDPVVSGLQRNLDLLLMQVARHAFIDVHTMPLGRFRTLDQCQNDILAEFENRRRHNPFDEDEDEFAPINRVHLQSSRQLEPRNGVEVREMEVEVRHGRQAWHFRIRLYRRGNGPVYVVRAYAPRRRLEQVKGELETALDSFRLLRR
ncbi:MAG TPA: DUF4190 domain-containing protein [Gemmataceae bacterium]|jgi:hypothetical protein